MLDILREITPLKLDSEPPKKNGESETWPIVSYEHGVIEMLGAKNLEHSHVQMFIGAKGQEIKEPGSCAIALISGSAGIATCTLVSSSAYCTYYTGDFQKFELDNYIFSNWTSHFDGLVRELREVCEQYQEDWDGYGAQPISEQACNDAERFVKMLPESVELPEITPVPDGDIALSGMADKRKFSL